jgi:osmotically-inducible protein OsmY
MPTQEGTTIQAPGADSAAISVGTARSDDRIVSRAMKALERENLLPGLRVRLSVEHGWLTLSGSAAHRVERSAAECVVRYVPGVKGVTNDLVVVLTDRR